ncbi:MAG: hypothetical protein H8D23_17675 [Candidatus Brocadiales bacterium]|nr:hypothetical protein [Candidatus Brocadiales bacterium]
MTRTQIIALVLFIGAILSMGLILWGVITSPWVWAGVGLGVLTFGVGLLIGEMGLLDEDELTVFDWFSDFSEKW